MVLVEWGATMKIIENVEVTLELDNRQRLEQFRGLRRQGNVGKFGTLTKSLLAIWTIRSRLRWSQMEVRYLLESRAKVTLAMF